MPLVFDEVKGNIVTVRASGLLTDDDYETFSQWKLDVGNGCNNDAINVITKGVAPEFDPAAHVRQVLPRVVGTLRPINIGNFNVWIVFPRDSSDLVLPP